MRRGCHVPATTHCREGATGMRFKPDHAASTELIDPGDILACWSAPFAVVAPRPPPRSAPARRRTRLPGHEDARVRGRRRNRPRQARLARCLIHQEGDASDRSRLAHIPLSADNSDPRHETYSVGRCVRGSPSVTSRRGRRDLVQSVCISSRLLSLFWIIFAVGFLVGLLLGRWGLLVPGLGALGWWGVAEISGTWSDPSRTGENFGAVGFLAAAVGAVIGMLGVLCGLMLRAAIRASLRRRHGGPDQ